MSSIFSHASIVVEEERLHPPALLVHKTVCVARCYRVEGTLEERWGPVVPVENCPGGVVVERLQHE